MRVGGCASAQNIVRKSMATLLAIAASSGALRIKTIDHH